MRSELASWATEIQFLHIFSISLKINNKLNDQQKCHHQNIGTFPPFLYQMFAVPVTAFSAASCLNQFNLSKDFPSEHFSISCPLNVQPYFFYFKKRVFEMEKLRDGRNCLRGCGHSFEIEEKHTFFMTLLTVCCSLFYAISDGPIIQVKNSLSYI